VVSKLIKKFWDFIKPTVHYKAAPNRKPCVKFGSLRVFYTGNLLGPCNNRSHNYTPCLRAEFSVCNTKTHRGVMKTDTIIIAYSPHSCYIFRRASLSCPTLLNYICLSGGDNKPYSLTLVSDILLTISVAVYSSRSLKTVQQKFGSFFNYEVKITRWSRCPRHEDNGKGDVQLHWTQLDGSEWPHAMATSRSGKNILHPLKKS